jgi:hypothetical protein
MQRLQRLLGVLTVGALAFGAVQARAAALPFTGVLSLGLVGIDGFGNPAFLPPVAVAGNGAANVVSSGNHINSLSIPASPFSVAKLVVPITDPLVSPLKGIQLTVHNGAGSFGGAPLGGAMPLDGIAKICLMKNCSFPVANISVPLSVVGAGGTAAYGTSLSVAVTVKGAPWTAGTQAVGTITQMGFVHGPASGTSSTAAASGAIRLVTPIFISTDIPAQAVVTGFGVLSLHFVPEPATLLLLVGGIAGLVLFGRTKRD